MKNVIIVWNKFDSVEFEKNIPLYYSGLRNIKLGMKSKIHLLFFYGLELLEKNYIDSLKDVGYILHDVSNIFKVFDNKYKVLERFGTYEKNCFLRWPVINEFFNKEKIIHYDGDIIFNENPDIFLDKFNDLTFVMQGCPAVTSVNSSKWFEQYLSELNLFTSDIEEYSRVAWKKREGWEISKRIKWSGYRDRPIITSDQDFISHLIHCDLIIQDNPEKIINKLSEYIIFDSPLYMDAVYPDTKYPCIYSRKNGIDFINDKKVALWHMHNDFNYYLSKFIIREKFLKILFSNKIENHYEKKDFENFLNKVIRKLIAKYRISRLEVYKYFFDKNNFSIVFNNKIWWKDEVFI